MSGQKPKRAKVVVPNEVGMAICGFLLAIACVLLPSEAAATRELHSCKIYLVHDRDMPAEVQEIRSMMVGSAVRVCEPVETPGPASYSIISPVVTGLLNVCHYTMRDVFQERGRNGRARWTYTPPPGRTSDSYRFMALKLDSICPERLNERYIVATRISEGLFVEILRFWQRVVTTGDIESTIAAESPKLILSDRYRSLAEALKSDQSSAAPLSVSSMRLYGVDWKSGVAQYEFQVSKTAVMWFLNVDFVDGELRIFDIR